MGYTTDQLTALENAIAQGVTQVKYADKTVEYRSLSEMIRLRNLMQAEINGGGSSRRFARHSKGLFKEDT